MLLTLVLWALMATVIYAVGIGLVPPGTFLRVGDRVIAALWVGFVVVSNAWLALALFMPLTFWRTLGLTALGVAALWLYRRRCNPEWTWLPKVDVTVIPPLLWLIGALGLISLAFFAAGPVTQWDTGLYHYPCVKWLETYGVVPGIALLYFPMGFSCSWYAFVAPFDVGWWHKRISAAGGFPIALLWLQSFLSVLRAQYNKAQISDWFILFTSGLMIPPFVHYYLSIACLATDIPTTALVVVVVWMLLRSAEMSHQGTRDPLSPAYPAWLTLVPAFGAFTCKLSAAPVMASSLLWALWQTRRRPTQWLWLTGLAVFLFTPVSIARFIASGYPFFPSALGTYPVEWAFDPQKISHIIAYIRDFARFLPIPTTLREGEQLYSTGWFDLRWLPRWIHFDTLSPIYLVLTFVAGVMLLRHHSHARNFFWIVITTWASCLYIIISAPTFRYGVGFFISLPALWVTNLLADGRTKQALWLLTNCLALTVVGMTIFLHRSFLIITIIIFNLLIGFIIEITRPTQQRLFTVFTWRQVRLITIALCISLTGIILFLLTFHKNQALHLLTRLVRPALLPTTNLTINRVNDVDIYYPVAGSQGACWDAPLPCGIDIDPAIALRSPQRGLAAGFKRLPSAGQE